MSHIAKTEEETKSELRMACFHSSWNFIYMKKRKTAYISKLR